MKTKKMERKTILTKTSLMVRKMEIILLLSSLKTNPRIRKPETMPRLVMLKLMMPRLVMLKLMMPRLMMPRLMTPRLMTPRLMLPNLMTSRLMLPNLMRELPLILRRLMTMVIKKKPKSRKRTLKMQKLMMLQKR